MERGVHAPLQSTIPPWSFQAWTSFMTGKNPGKHGVYDFFRTPLGTYDLEFVNAGHRRGGANLWQILSQSGRKVISIGVPATFPPDPVNGVMISGFDFPGEGPGTFLDARGIYPREALAELHREVGRYPIDPPILREMDQGRFDVALERILDTIDRQAAAAKYLALHRPWDFFMMVFGESDGVSHYFWQFCDPNSPFWIEEPAGLEDSMLRVYQRLDDHLGDLLSSIPGDTMSVVMSDHGSGGISQWVLFPNLWLEEKGFIRLRNKTERKLSQVRQKFRKWGVATLPSWVQRTLYRRAVKTLGRFEARLRYGIIDWPQTQAYFDENPYYPVVRVNLKGRQPMGIVKPGSEYEELRARLIEDLESWRHPETGERIIEKAYRREEVYAGECFAEAADIVPKWALDRGYNYGFRVSSQSPDGRWITQMNPRRKDSPFFPRKFSSHRDQAIFAAKGPGIDPDSRLNNIRIIDLAPTILKCLDVDVPEDMDGRVLEELFATTAGSRRG
jgi:predicted AlkP superfamily phosphohydrolase/phosphomutase